MKTVSKAVVALGLLGVAYTGYAAIFPDNADAKLNQFIADAEEARAAAPGSVERGLAAAKSAASLKDYLDTVSGGLTGIASDLTLLVYVYRYVIPSLSGEQQFQQQGQSLEMIATVPRVRDSLATSVRIQ